MDLGLLIRDALQPLRDPALADRPALSLEDAETWTYRELHERIEQYAGALRARGVQPGDRVGILLYNSLEYVGLYFAIARIGGIAVRLNWRLQAEELEYAIDDSGCAVLCLHDDFAELLAPLRERLPVHTYVFVPYEGLEQPDWTIHHDELLTGEPIDGSVPTPATGDRAMIMYTSGTTGRPKGAVWTHGNSTTFAAMQQIFFGLDAGTVALTTSPLFHVGGLEDILLATWLVKGHTVLMRSKNFSIERAMELLQSLGVTDVMLQPTMIYDMLDAPGFAPDQLTLRRIYTGGTALYEWALERMSADLPEVAVYSLYGLTEGGAISTGMRLRSDGKHINSVGVPLPLTEVRVVADEDGTEAAEGVDGEVWVRSASGSREYWNKPEANASTFVDGWCRTGDQGRVSEGLLFITGRIKDMIRSGGENIYPIEVENALMRHPDIVDVAVVGVPDPKFQETVCAVVVVRDDATPDADGIVDFCRTRLAGYKKPRHVVFTDELPRTPSGKVQKHLLRTAYNHLGAA